MTGPEVLCASCGAALPAPHDDTTEVRCGAGHPTPVVAGIIDCRPPLAGFDAGADRRRALDLAAREDASFEDLLRRYWATHPDVAPELAARFTRGDLIGADRATEVVDQIEAEAGRPADPATVVLEVGCGTAALGAALAHRTSWVVASDVSLAWLVLARRRIRSLGIDNVTLVAAPADRLPFRDGTFGLVVAADVIEHVPDVDGMVRSCARVLRTGGTMWVSTPNRYSLTPEPHVRLWGVGFLPRSVALRYVRRFRGVDYHDVRTLSAWRLRRALQAGGARVRVDVPPIAGAVRATYGPVARRAIDGYHLARRVPVARQALLLVAPLFHGTLHKDRDAA